MAIDRPSGAPALDSETIADLRAVLSRSAQSGTHVEELKALLTRVAGEARQKGILAEQLLVQLKDIWYSLPNVATQPGSEVQSRLLQQLIARSIQEYYSS